jgi:hypothetical protein
MSVVDAQRHLQFYYDGNARQLRHKDDKNVGTVHDEHQNYRDDFQF